MRAMAIKSTPQSRSVPPHWIIWPVSRKRPKTPGASTFWCRRARTVWMPGRRHPLWRPKRRKSNFWSPSAPVWWVRVYAAQQANTLDYFTKGRLSLNVVSGANSADLRRYGYHAPHDERYEVTEEFLDIVHRLWQDDGPSITRVASSMWKTPTSGRSAIRTLTPLSFWRAVLPVESESPRASATFTSTSPMNPKQWRRKSKRSKNWKKNSSE